MHRQTDQSYSKAGETEATHSTFTVLQCLQGLTTEL